MIYTSIDIETTGLNPNIHQVLEVGAVMCELGGDIFGQFRAVLLWDNLLISPRVISMHSALLEEMNQATEGSIPGQTYSGVYCRAVDLEAAFMEWHRRLTSDPKITVAGKNFNAFDRRFLEPLMPNVKFRHRVLDPTTLYTQCDDDVPPSLPMCCKRAGIEATGYHTALGDAMTVRALLEAKLS